MLDIFFSLLANHSIMMTFIAGTVVPFLFCWTLLNKFPSFLHRRRSLGNKGLCNIIAHRGSREEGLPENTLSAFKDAIAAGTNVIELDVWLTKDNEVVIHHDETFTRMTNGQCTAKITESNYDQLPLICPPHGQNARCDAATTPLGKEVVASTSELQRYCTADWARIPKLKDVLNLIPSSSNVAVIVEIKQDSNLLIDKVHRLLTEQPNFDYRESCYWFSLTESINKKLRAKDRNIATITSIQGMLRVLGLHYLGYVTLLHSIDHMLRSHAFFLSFFTSFITIHSHSTTQYLSLII